jgi:hypothetical protein
MVLVFAVGAIAWRLLTGVWFRSPEPQPQHVVVNDASRERR